MTIDYVAIGKTIRDLRVKEGMTQEYLSSSVEIDPAYLSRIENGIKKPSLSILLSIAYNLGVSLDDLVYDSADPANFSLTEKRISNLLKECTPSEQELVYALLKEMLRFFADKGLRL